jgi:hypothetical protein
VQRKELLAQGRILPHDTWEKYNTNHVTYVPAQMTVEELQKGYDWLCRRLYSPGAIAMRGLRAWKRHWPDRARQRLFSSFSTDVGYRWETAHRLD